MKHETYTSLNHVADGNLSRRQLLKILGASAASVAFPSLLAACASESTTRTSAATSAAGGTAAPATTRSDTITVSVWGGETEQAFVDAVVPAFQEATGGDAAFEVGSGGERFSKLLAQRDSPTADIFVNTGENIVQAYRQGLLADFDESLIPNLGEVAEWARPNSYGAYGVTYGLVAYGLVSVNEHIDEPLTSWLDLWRPELQGKLALPNIPHSAMTQFLIVISELNGGSIDDIQPGLEALAELDPALLTFFWTDWAPGVASGEVWAATEYNYEIVSMQKEGFDVTFRYPEEKGLAAGNVMAIVDRPDGNIELAHEFINTVLDADVNTKFCETWHGSPANENATIAPSIEGEVRLASEILDQVRFFDDVELADRRAEWTEQLNQVVLASWE